MIVHRLHDRFVLLGSANMQKIRETRRIKSAFAPKQPVTRTRPFWAMASAMASIDSSTASFTKPQVLIITTSAPS